MKNLFSILTRNEKLGALVFYLGVVCVVYSPVVFFGKSLQSPIYHPYTVTNQGAYDYQGRKPFGAFNVDVSNATITDYPVDKLIGDIYRQGKLPLWNPYKGVGQPLAEQLGQSAFFPYQVLKNLAPVGSWDFFLLGRLVIVGFFTFLFLRSISVSRIGSLFGGLAYMLSGSFTWFINNEEMVNPAMMAPIVLWSVENLLQKLNTRFLIFSTLSFGLILTAGTPGVTSYVLLLILAYAIFRITTLDKVLKPVLVLLISLILGFSLAAPLFLPTFEFLQSAVALRGDLGSAVVSAWHFGYVLFPGLADVPVGYRFGISNGLWDAIGGYTGILPFYFAVLGLLAFLALRRNLPRGHFGGYLVFFLLAGLLILLKNYGLFPFVLIGKLPFLQTVWSPRWSSPAWGLAFAIAGAIGFELTRLHRRLLIDKWARILRSLTFKLSAIPLGLLLIGLFYKRLNDFLVNQQDKIITLRNLSNSDLSFYFSVAVGVIFLTTLVLFYSKGGRKVHLFILGLLALELWLWVPRGYQMIELKIIPYLLGLGAVLLILQHQPARPPKIIWPLTALTLFLVYFNVADFFSPYGWPQRFDSFNEPPFVKYLKSQDGYFRSLGAKGVLMPNWSSAYSLADIRHIDAVTERNFFAFRKNVLDIEEYPFWFINFPTQLSPSDLKSFPLLCQGRQYQPAEQKSLLTDRLDYFSLLGVKYILVPPNLGISDVFSVKNQGEFPLVYDGEVRIYQNPEALPRAFFARKVGQVNSVAEAHEVLKDNTLARLKEKVFLEEPLTSNTLTLDADSRAAIVSYTPTRVLVETENSSQAFLVLTDLFYPGWQALIDGKLVRIHRVDGLFRGVLVPPGKHSVVFEYKPVSFYRGLAATLTIPLVLALFFLAARGGPSRSFLWLLIFLILGSASYYQGRVVYSYVQNRSTIHADPGLITETERRKRILLEGRRREMNFVTQHLAKLIPYPQEGIAGVESFHFPESQANPFYLVFRNSQGNRRRMLIRVIKEDDPEYGYDQELKPLVDYMFGEYYESGKFRTEDVGTLPPFFVQDIQDVKFIRALFFYWQKEVKILETRLYVSLNYAELENGQWVLKLGRPNGLGELSDGFRYDCETANWRK